MSIIRMSKTVEPKPIPNETQNLHDVINSLDRQVLRSGSLANETSVLLNRISTFSSKDIPQPPVDDNQGCIIAFLLFLIDRLKDVNDKAEANLTHLQTIV